MLVRDTEATGLNCLRYLDGAWQPESAVPAEEYTFSVFVNQKEIATLQCTPEKLNCLAVGFLAAQRILSSVSDISTMRVCIEDHVADLVLKTTPTLPVRRVITSGCSGGVSYYSEVAIPPVVSSRTFSPAQVTAATELLRSETGPAGYGRRRGMHRSVLTDGSKALVVADDIGRHNTVDKILGECLLKRMSTAEVLVTTGRISSEMVTKAARMQTPLIISLNSATTQAVELGTRLRVSIVGYAGKNRFTVFCGQDRLHIANNLVPTNKED